MAPRPCLARRLVRVGRRWSVGEEDAIYYLILHCPTTKNENQFSFGHGMEKVGEFRRLFFLAR